MSDSRKKLERAFKLIKRDNTEEAQEIVRPILEEEPENVDAWWLLAYAATDPHEVREALVNVLRLDPEYANAPQAREMLDQLNAEYPPDQDELSRFPELAEATPEVPATTDSSEFDTAEFVPEPVFDALDTPEAEPFSDDIFGDVFQHSEIPAIDEKLFVSEDPFSDFPEEVLELEADEGVDFTLREAEPASASLEEEIRQALGSTEPQQLDEEALAALEERAAQRSSRARRLAGLLAIVPIVLLVLVAIFLLIQPDDEQIDADPVELELLDVNSPAVAESLQAVAGQVQWSTLGQERQAVVAKSETGDALVIQICDRPGPGMPRVVADAMAILAQQSPLLQDQLGVVGVDMSICMENEQDTLYRAFATVSDAQRYARNEISLAAFQATWKPS